MDGFVAIAEVVKAVGLKGEIKLYPLLDFHAPLLESRYLVWDDGTPVDVRRQRPAGACVAVQPAGSRDRDQAEALVGREVGFLRRDYLAVDFPRPPAGLPFRYLDREVVTVGGEAVGRVAEVRRGGGQLLLVVAGRDGEVLVPAVAPILRPDAGLDGELVVDPPEGLLDANVG